MPTIPDSPTVSLGVAAKLLGVSPSTAYTAVRNGKFPVPVIHVGSRIAVPTAPLRKLLCLDSDDRAAGVAR